MPAKLVVVSGTQPGQEFWIEEEVLRIGSEEPCEVRLVEPGLPPHVATLEFRPDGYALYNRGDQPIRLDRRALAPRDPAARWPAGKDLALNDQLTLRLVVDGDPAPAKRATPGMAPLEPSLGVLDQAPAADPLAADAAAKKAKNTTTIAVVVGAAVLCAGVLLMDPPKVEEKTQYNPGQKLKELVTTLLKDKTGDPADNEYLRNGLQNARLAELRGDKKLAREEYNRLYDWLERTAKTGPLPTEYKDLLAFVKTELKRLQPKTEDLSF